MVVAYTGKTMVMRVESVVSETKSVPEGKIPDLIDGTFRDDKPEERVRQALLRRLVGNLGYVPERVEVEKSIKFGSSRKRVDIALFPIGTQRKQEDIEVIIECKAERVSPADRVDGVEQLKSYMSACLNARWGLWTNGKHREVWEKVSSGDNGASAFVERLDLPTADGRRPDRRRRHELEVATGDVLLYAFRSAHNYIHAVDGFQKEKSFFELLKVIFCKILDERQAPKALEFYAAPEEINAPDGQLAAARRIHNLFSAVKVAYPQIFGKHDAIELQARSLVRIVGELQPYSLLRSNVDVKGAAYEEIVGSNLKGDRGQFFTPRNVMSMAVQMLAPKPNERVLDPACGTGGFLVTAMLSMAASLEAAYTVDFGKHRAQWTLDEARQFDDRIQSIIGGCYFGFDISPELVRASKMNMVMNNDGSANMLREDSLLPPFRWNHEFRESLAEGLNRSIPVMEDAVDPDTLVSWESLAQFDVIVTNPPFGSKIVIRDTEILEQYSLGHIWEKTKNGWEQTPRLQSGVPPEQLFLERCVQLLRPGGRMAIVLPDSILGAPGLEYIREWLFEHTHVVASVDLHQDAFQPNVGVQTSVLILVKRDASHENAADALYDEVFMAMVERIGHDKRGSTLYVRDDYGDEILQHVEEEFVDDGGNALVVERAEKVVDDQTVLIPALFHEWMEGRGISW